MRTRLFASILIASAGFTLPVLAQMSARQLFYDEGKEATPPKPAAKKAVPDKTDVAVRKVPPAPPKADPTPVTEPVKQTVIAATPPSPPIGPTTTNVVLVYAPPAMRYSVLRIADQKEEVNDETVFHEGDRIQVRLESNQDGFLYIINRGSSGKWIPLFPQADINDGSNRIQGHKPIFLPSEEHTISFDGKPGQELLFIIFSPNPITDVDQLLQQLKQPENSKPNVVLAQSVAPMDALVNNYRKVYARDLLIEKVSKTPAKPSGNKPMRESAVYVASPSNAPDARVIADLRLNHE